MVTRKLTFLFCTVVFFALLSAQASYGQINWALTASFEHGGPGTNGTGSATATAYGFGEYHYNNGIIPAYPAKALNAPPAPDDYYTFVSSGGYIKIWWNFPNPVAASGPINKIVFYKNARPVTSCIIEHFDPATGNWTTNYIYNNTTNLVADSIYLDVASQITITVPANPAVRDTIRISNIQGERGQGNPDFREIELWTVPQCSGTPAPTITASLYNSPPTAGPAPLNPFINPCLGYTVYFAAQSSFATTGHHYQWEINTGAAWVSIPGATGMGYNYTSASSAQIRVADTCINTGLYAVSNAIQVNYTPIYQAFNPVTGYYMGFDNAWASSNCLPAPFARDLPAIQGWSNGPPYGPNTWRIDTTSVGTSGWSSTGTGQYSAALTTYPYGVPFPAVQNRSARIHTGHSTFFSGMTGELDLYIDLSTTPSDKALYFYYINQGAVNSDSLRILLSTDEGVSWSRLAAFDSAQVFKKRLVPLPVNAPKSIIRFEGYKNNVNESSDIGLDSVFIAAPCTGTPTAGLISPSNTISVCPGTSLNLTTLGATMAGGLIYTWEQSTNGGVSYNPVSGGSGSDNLFFTTPPIYNTIRYRLKLECAYGGVAAYSDVLNVTLSSPAPVYAALPYKQNFETSWTFGCATGSGQTGDIPGNPNAGAKNWTNIPATGNNSWRRDDGGNSTWTVTPTAGFYTGIPSSPHYARFHSSGSTSGQKGQLDVLFNGSGSTGNKEVRFSFVNSSGSDSLNVFSSSDAGSNFTKLGSYKTTPLGWTQYIVQSPCNSPNCIIRFQGVGDLGNQSDLGIDSVMILPPCNGQPVAGAISSASPCPGAPFTLNLSGYSNSGSVVYEWYQKTQPNGGWGSVVNTGTFYNTSIFTTTYYMVVVRCLTTLQTDTAFRTISLAPFYACYCNSGATAVTGPNIGNVNIKKLPAFTNVLNNGSATPNTNNSSAIATYSDFRNTVTPPAIYLDSTYQLFVSQINSGQFQSPGATVTAWIDIDRSGTFDNNEIVLQQNSVNTTIPPQQTNATFSLPTGMPVGLTGMRVIIQQGINGAASPCGPYATGETEDYLIDVRYHPCGGPTYAGIAEVSDTAGCVGLTVTLVDTTHEQQRYGISWVWEYSPDSNSWADIPNSAGTNTVVTTLTALTYYRLRMICGVTFDTTYSNVQKVLVNPPYACYCLSYADGGQLYDTSDIGGVVLDTMLISNYGYNGPHLYNSYAVKARTDLTKNGVLHLWVDSTYQFSVFHIQNSGTHGDAKVTLFLDLNNDNFYNIGGQFDEHLWTAFSTAPNFYVTTAITIPHYAIPDVMTGMRIILNNNTGPNKQSDSACGTYTSGETEDYVVMFHKYPTGISTLDNISRLLVYPNPTQGLFTVSFETRSNINAATITITSLTGQVLMQKNYAKPGKRFSEEMDLRNMSRGVYLVELKAGNERQTRKLVIQ